MKQETLEKDKYYHIFNRGINGGLVFKNEENMRYFLTLTEKHLSKTVTILAYCLLKNQYHFLVRIDSESETVAQSFSNLFKAYAKAFNKQQNRTGSLFKKHFKRKQISSDEYLKNIILYIHKNPENHEIVSDFSEYKYSSFNAIVSNNSKMISTKEVLELFGGIDNFVFTHKNKDSTIDLQGLENLAGQENLKNHLTKNTYKVFKTLQDEALQDNRFLKDESPNLKNKFYSYIEDLQEKITSKLEKIDGKATFKEDIWVREEGGGGKTRVIENGAIFEKGGVNISSVYGELPEVLRNQFGVKEGDFFACGLSLVLHPINPFVPTVHANWRYFEMYNASGEIVRQWFGGGQDLTPYYLFEEDAIHFHQVCKTACDKHHPNFYPTFKKNCDEYFWNTHRNEARGIGGLFFDYLKQTTDFSMDDRYNFVTEIGNSFLNSYLPIVEKRKNTKFNQQQKDWQEIRRGRYVEFNLVHDKGTLFGLKTNGRIESILMSLPPKVQWKYNNHPKENTKEANLIAVLQNPKNWV